MQFHHDDPSLLWVNESVPGGHGSYESPFPSIEEGLERIQPGQTLVLQSGEYTTDCTIQTSGSYDRPIRICAEGQGTAVIRSACWFLYDVSDLIISDLVFIDAPYGAISVVGECSRNRFASLRFVNCGTRKKASCTLYFGGAGGGCNVIEECSFEHAAQQPGAPVTVENAAVGLMIAQGDAGNGNPIVDIVVRRNRFLDYGLGILIGGDGSRSARCGHVIEYNRVSGCTQDGILVKSGDTTMRGNVIEKCPGNSLSVQSELDCTVEENRVIDCGRGIVVQGRGHTVTNNCIIRCGGGAIRAMGMTDPATSNCIIERNTIVDCALSLRGDDVPVAGVVIDHGTTGVIQYNLIYGVGKPYAVVGPDQVSGDRSSQATAPATRFMIKDNGSAGGCSLLDGVGSAVVEFVDAPGDNYENGSGFGAGGWMLTPSGFDPDIDKIDEGADYRSVIPSGIDDPCDSEPSGMDDAEPNDAPVIEDPEDPFSVFYGGMYDDQ